MFHVIKDCVTVAVVATLQECETFLRDGAKILFVK